MPACHDLRALSGTRPARTRVRSLDPPTTFAPAGAVEEAVYNYFSMNDNVLKIAFRIAQVALTAAGLASHIEHLTKLTLL